MMKSVSRNRWAWRKETDRSVGFTNAVLFVFFMHTVIHLFAMQYMIRVPSSLAQNKRVFFGLQCSDVLLLGAVLVVLWALCHAPAIRDCRWKAMHAVSLAVLVVSAIGTVWYITVFRKFDAYYRREVSLQTQEEDRRASEKAADGWSVQWRETHRGQRDALIDN